MIRLSKSSRETALGGITVAGFVVEVIGMVMLLNVQVNGETILSGPVYPAMGMMFGAAMLSLAAAHAKGMEYYTERPVLTCLWRALQDFGQGTPYLLGVLILGMVLPKPEGLVAVAIGGGGLILVMGKQATEIFIFSRNPREQ